jgi:RNA-directed DNA polymerase
MQVHPATEPKGPTDWNAVNWRRTYRNVRALRQRIFKAEREGDRRKVRSLQKLMLRSYSNTLISVRQVTQLNAGRNTAGVDQVIVKTPEARGTLVDELMRHQPWRAHPVKWVYIPKSDGKRVRPLGIPAIIDRALQACVKNALEPQWEARFEASSYGFRPGRSAHDAIEAVYALARPHMRKKWVVDADIKGAFDNLSQAFILKAVEGFPARALIHQWLKVGYLENGVLHGTPTGVPQGGPISPLLLNVALHGMEAALEVRRRKCGAIIGDRAVVRYANDLVVFCESHEDAEVVRQILRNWLHQRGLELSEDKTRIVHVHEGFSFLGFDVRQFPVRHARTGYKLLIRPSKEAVKRFRARLRTEWFVLRGTNILALLTQLNPIIRGWANYYRHCCASQTFCSLDYWMYLRCMRYAKQRHPNKSQGWRLARYFGCLNPHRDDRWVFGDKRSGGYLLKFHWIKIKRHVKVSGSASPDDPTLRDYWQRRQRKIKSCELPKKLDQIASRQHYICPVCGESHS